MSVLIALVALCLGAVICVAGLGWHIARMQRWQFRGDVASARGSAAKGVLHAFTLGMLPWEKESARLHWVAYLRGVVFHAGIFLGTAFLISTPWLTFLSSTVRLTVSVLFAIAAVAALTGFWLRSRDPILRAVSTADDYFSLTLATVFLISASLCAADAQFLPLFWMVSAITLAYTPFGKLRHFLYFFYSRGFFGWISGHRGILR